MVITEVRIKLMEDNNENERLQAFCSVTFDDAFVIRDLKIIEGTKGSFVAMPSRKLTDRCHRLRQQEPPARAASATSAAASSTRTAPPATPTAAPSCTPTSPTRSTAPAARSSRAPSSRPSRRRRNAPSSPATSAPTTTTTATTTARTSYTQIVSEMSSRGYRTHGAATARARTPRRTPPTARRRSTTSAGVM